MIMDKGQSEDCSFLLNVKGRMGFKDKLIKMENVDKYNIYDIIMLKYI